MDWPRPWPAPGGADTTCPAASGSASPSPAPSTATPPVIVLDEPTSALDARAEHRILSRLRELAAGRTALFITHRLANARTADRIVVLRDGAIAETGTYTELLARNGSLFYELHRLQEGQEAAPISL
ncbi:hypothetical protein GCM10020000_85460 [Streptomyces olivoverticillatus]